VTTIPVLRRLLAAIIVRASVPAVEAGDRPATLRGQVELRVAVKRTAACSNPSSAETPKYVSRLRVIAILLALAGAVAIVAWAGGRGAEQSEEPAGSGVRVDPRLPMPAGRIVGFVRDVNGTPVPGARVRLMGSRGSVRTTRSGSFELPAQPGRRTVVADHPAYTRQSVPTDLRRGRAARVDFALAVTAPDRVPVVNSADRLIVWTSCKQLAGLSEGALRRWVGRGVDGFVCQTGPIRGMGGTQDFTGDHRARLSGSTYRLQRRLRDSPAGHRAAEGKLLLYLGFYMVNYFNKSTPLDDWFDDRAWSRKVLPRVRDLAAAARSMSFAGIALDQELYPQQGNARTASWSWSYPGNGHSEAQVRAKVKDRGRQLMETMARAYPGLELVGYDTRLPDTWQAKVAAEINHERDASADDVRIDLWDGLSSIDGYSAIRWMDAVFHKTFHLSGATWDTALDYNASRIYSELSRRFSNWSYASSRLHVSPFSWVDEGPPDSAFSRARSPGYVAEQLEAFNKWGAGGAFANYAYGELEKFDYSPYVDALRRASRPARVDRQPPKLALTSSQRATRRVVAGERASLKGVASDNFAIRAVRWYDDRGRQGVARLTWMFSGDERSGWHGETDWSIDNLTIPRDATRVTIVAEDIKGLATELPLTVSR
jgi:carboxypeptidase family protein